MGKNVYACVGVLVIVFLGLLLLGAIPDSGGVNGSVDWYGYDENGTKVYPSSSLAYEVGGTEMADLAGKATWSTTYSDIESMSLEIVCQISRWHYFENSDYWDWVDMSAGIEVHVDTDPLNLDPRMPEDAVDSYEFKFPLASLFPTATDGDSWKAKGVCTARWDGFDTFGNVVSGSIQLGNAIEWNIIYSVDSGTYGVSGTFA